jgi:hypothetical protein
MCGKLKLSCFQLKVGGKVLVEIYGRDRSSSGGCGRTDVISQGMIRQCWLGLTQNMLKTDVSGLQSTTAFLMELGSGIHDCALGKFIYTTITLVAGACMLFVPVLRPRYINLPWVAMSVLKWFSKDCVVMPTHAHCWYLYYMLHFPRDLYCDYVHLSLLAPVLKWQFLGCSNSCFCHTQLVCTNYLSRRSIAIPPSGTPITVNSSTRFWADNHFCELEIRFLWTNPSVACLRESPQDFL